MERSQLVPAGTTQLYALKRQTFMGVEVVPGDVVDVSGLHARKVQSLVNARYLGFLPPAAPVPVEKTLPEGLARIRAGVDLPDREPEPSSADPDHDPGLDVLGLGNPDAAVEPTVADAAPAGESPAGEGEPSSPAPTLETPPAQPNAIDAKAAKGKGRK